MDNNNKSLLPGIRKLFDARDIQGLIDILESPDEDIVFRRQAVIALGKTGDERAINPLIRALDDEDRMIPYAALTSLGEIGLPAFSHLLNFLKITDNEKLVEWMAKSAFGKIGEPALKTLTEALLNAPEPRLRKNAAIILGLIKNKSAVQPLIECLKDEDAEVRARSADALGEIGAGEAVEPLIEALKDDDDEVRISAARALGEIGDVRAAESLIEALYNRSWEVQQIAADALGKIGGKKVVQALIEKLKTGDEIVRMSASYSLGETGGFRAVFPLLRTAIMPGALCRPIALRSVWDIVRKKLVKT